jgi:hypothetical protein
VCCAIEAPCKKEEVNKNQRHREDQVTGNAEYSADKTEGPAGGLEYSAEYLLEISSILPYSCFQLTQIDTVVRRQSPQVIRQPLHQVSHLRDEKRSNPCEQRRATRHHDSQQERDCERPRPLPLPFEPGD